MKKPKKSDDTPLLVGDYDQDMVEPWIDYLYGKWEKGLPELPGDYAIATLEGDYVGLRRYVMSDGEVVDCLQPVNEPGWLGFRWSVALPPPPRAVRVK